MTAEIYDGGYGVGCIDMLQWWVLVYLFGLLLVQHPEL